MLGSPRFIDKLILVEKFARNAKIELKTLEAWRVKASLGNFENSWSDSTTSLGSYMYFLRSQIEEKRSGGNSEFFSLAKNSL